MLIKHNKCIHLDINHLDKKVKEKKFCKTFLLRIDGDISNMNWQPNFLFFFQKVRVNQPKLDNVHFEKIPLNRLNQILHMFCGILTNLLRRPASTTQVCSQKRKIEIKIFMPFHKIRTDYLPGFNTWFLIILQSNPEIWSHQLKGKVSKILFLSTGWPDLNPLEAAEELVLPGYMIPKIRPMVGRVNLIFHKS